MRLTFYDEELNRIADIFTCLSLRWLVLFNDVGSCTISFHETAEINELTGRGKYVTLKEDESKTVMILMGLERINKTITLHGKSALWILKRRVSEEYNEDRVHNITAGTAISNLINKAFSNAQWGVKNRANILVKEETSVLPQTEIYTTLSGEDVLSQVLGLAHAYGIGLTSHIAGDNIEIVIGNTNFNKKIPLFEKFGNVFDVKYITSDEELYNVAVVKGMFDGFKIIGYAGNTNSTGSARNELPVTCPESEAGETVELYTNRLNEVGQKALKEQKFLKDLTFQTAVNVPIGANLEVTLERPAVTISTACMAKTYTFQDNEAITEISVGEIKYKGE